MPIGKLLGQGHYGCVYDTEFACKVSNELEYATKVTVNNEDLEEEVKFSKKLYKAEKENNVPKGTYFIGVERPCELQKVEYVRHGVKNCQAPKVKDLIVSNKTNKLVAVFTPKINGSDYRSFEWSKMSIPEIWAVWLHLWKGLHIMHEDAGMIAYDIKHNNIMMSNELKPKYAKIYGKYHDKKSIQKIIKEEGKDSITSVPKYIDFGLSKKINMSTKDIEYMVTNYKRWSEKLRKTNQGKLFSRDTTRENLYKNFKLAKKNKDLKQYMKSIDIFALAKTILRPYHLINQGKNSPLKTEADTKQYIKALKACPNILKLFEKCMDPVYSNRPTSVYIIRHLKKSISANKKS